MATVDSLEVQIEVSANGANKSLEKLANTLSRIQKQLGKKTSSSNLNSLKTSATKLNSDFSKTEKITKNTTAGFGKMAIAVNLLRKSFDALGNSVKSSMDYIETYNYFQNAFGQVASKANLGDWEELGYASAEEYYNSFSKRARELTQKMSGFNIADDGSLSMGSGKSLGIDPNQVMQYQAVFGQMSSSIGIASETSLKLSNALTQIGADLASVKNMDFNKVWTDMQSGLAGMSRTMDKYGANIRNVNLQQKINELGIKANIQNLNQNDKALLRSIIILDSTRYAWGDLSETINAPANQFRLLQSNVTNLARSIGNLLLPVVAKILPYVNAAIMGLTKMMEYIAKVFGIDTSEWGSSFSGASDAMSDILDQTEEEAGAVDNVTNAIKKMRQQLHGIDELNVISSDQGQGDALGGITGGVSSATGALEDALNKILEEYNKSWNIAYENMKMKSQEILNDLELKARAVGLEFWKGFDAGNVSAKGAELVEKWKGIVEQIKGLFTDEGVSSALSEMGSSAIQAAGSVAGAVTSILTSFGFGVAGGTEDALEESEGYIKNKMISIANSVKDLNDKIKEFAKGVAEIATAFESEAFQNIVKIFEKIVGFIALEAWDRFQGVTSDLFGIFSKPLSDNATKWKELLENVLDIVSKLLSPLDSLIDLLMDNSKDYEDSFLHKVLSGIADFASKKIGEKLDEVNKNLKTFSGYLDDIKETWETLTGKNDKELTLTAFFDLGTTSLDIAEMWNDILGWWGKRSLVAGLVIDILQNLAKWVKDTFDAIKKQWGDKDLSVGIILETGITKLWNDLKKNWGNNKQLSVGTKPKNTKKTVKSMWSGVKKAWNASDKSLSIDTIAKLASGAVKSMQDEVNKTPLTMHANVEFKIADGKRLNWDAGLQKWFYYYNGQKFYVAKNGGIFNNGKWKDIAQYAGGGLPNYGSLFVAGEAGPEIVGHVGGQSEVLNQSQLASVMYNAVADGNAQSNALLARQNQLLQDMLQAILEKETGINYKDVFRAAQKGASDYTSRTGRPAFA